MPQLSLNRMIMRSYKSRKHRAQGVTTAYLRKSKYKPQPVDNGAKLIKTFTCNRLKNYTLCWSRTTTDRVWYRNAHDKVWPGKVHRAMRDPFLDLSACWAYLYQEPGALDHDLVSTILESKIPDNQILALRLGNNQYVNADLPKTGCTYKDVFDLMGMPDSVRVVGAHAIKMTNVDTATRAVYFAEVQGDRLLVATKPA